MSAPENSKPSLRIPPWLRVKLPCSHTFSDTRALVEGLDLHTVCHSAKCPNMFECFSRKTATFLILGNTCTRNCAFCNIGGGIILAPDPEEPARVGKAAAALGLRHAVVTSVTRDDLTDGGSAHFAATIRPCRDSGETCPTIEVLIPDFRGSREDPANRHGRRSPTSSTIMWKPRPRITAASGLRPTISRALNSCAASRKPGASARAA